MLKEQIVGYPAPHGGSVPPNYRCVSNISEPSPSNRTEQEVYQVQRDYYAIPYGLQLSVLVDAVRSGKGRIDNLDATKQPMADAQSFQASVSDITTGNTADIQSQPLADFATIPASRLECGSSCYNPQSRSQTQTTSHTTIKATWRPMETQPPAELVFHDHEKTLPES